MPKTFILDKCDPKKFISYMKIDKGKRIFLEGLDLGNREINLHIDYNEFEIKKTTVPKGYRKYNNPLGNRDNLEYINSNQCGDKIRINKIQLKKFPIVKGYKHYFIQDNFQLPYVVYIKNKEVLIFKKNKNYFFLNNCDFENKKSYTELVLELKDIEKIFVPKNNGEPGNTILVHIKKGKKNKYLYIGGTINEFQIDDEIVEYYSPIHTSGSPDPIAYGKKNIYFLYYNLVSNKDKYEKKIQDLFLDDKKIDEDDKELMSEYLYEVIEDKSLIKKFKYKTIVEKELDI